MDENFSKFKRKVWLDILIKCILIGLASALSAVVLVMLPCKLCGVSLLWAYYLLIGLGGAVIGGGVAFFVFRTDDVTVARRLDSELKLEERVRTSFEFSSQHSDMLSMQRESTSQLLSMLPARALPIKNVVAIAMSAVTMAVGIAMIPIIQYVVPTVVAEATTGEEPEDPDRPITDWEETALDSLIEYVRNSKKADSMTKSGMLYELEGLRELLLKGVSENNLKLFVQNSVTNIRNLVKDANAVDGVSEEQQQLNSQESTYVINKLYEIFKLDAPGGTAPNPDDDDDDDDDKKQDEEETELPPSTIKGNELPVFDLENGKVKLTDEFLERVQEKFDKGDISQEEYEYYFEYFNGLIKNDDNN